MTELAARVRELVRERALRLGDPLVALEECASTNDEAKEGARAGAPHGATWLAESQTRGRGRQGRTWSSGPGDALLVSVLLRIPCEPSRVPQLSLACGLAVRDAVAKAVSDDASVVVKWPNDVLVRGRKVAGILIESSISAGPPARTSHVVVGIGINVHARELPDELQAIATSVARERSAVGGTSAPDRAEILADVLAGLDRDVELVAFRGLTKVRARLSARDALAGRTVEVDGFRGVASGIDDEGRLLVRSAETGEIRRVVAGDVHLGLRK